MQAEWGRGFLEESLQPKQKLAFKGILSKQDYHILPHRCHHQADPQSHIPNYLLLWPTCLGMLSLLLWLAYLGMSRSWYWTHWRLEECHHERRRGSCYEKLPPLLAKPLTSCSWSPPEQAPQGKMEAKRGRGLLLQLTSWSFGKVGCWMKSWSHSRKEPEVSCEETV